jgi:hypothetical protein
MPQSYVQYRGNGSTVTFAVPFPYINRAHVTAKVDGVPAGFTWGGDATINLSHTVPGSGSVVEVRRVTPNTSRLVDFVDGSTPTADDLDLVGTQFLYLSQEAQDRADEAPRLTAQNTYDFQGRRATNLADPVNAQDAVTKTWAETAQSSTLAQAQTARDDARTAVTDAKAQVTLAAGKVTEAGAQVALAAGKVTEAGAQATAAKGSADAAKASATSAEASAVRAEQAANNPAPGTESAIEKATVVSTNLQPPWTDGKGIFDRVRVSVGPTTPDFWPGGGVHLGAYSAITGTLNVPREADQGVDKDGNPLTIISAGVSGLVQTQSNKQVGVGLFGMARVGRDQGRVWGLNVVTANWPTSYDVPQYGYGAQINGIEIDCGWKATQNPVTGSNLIGIWIPAEFKGGRPDGSADAIKIGRCADFGWKTFLNSDHGGADTFAQIGMIEPQETKGPKPSSKFYFISSSGGQKTAEGDTNVYHHSYFSHTSGGDFIFQPDTNGGAGGLVVGNANLTQICSMHPANGVSGPKGTFNTLQVNQDADVKGTLQVRQNAAVTGNLNVGGDFGAAGKVTTGNLQVNQNARVEGNFYAGNNIEAGVEVKGARGVFTDLYFKGLPVAVGAPNAVVQGYRALFIPN